MAKSNTKKIEEFDEFEEEEEEVFDRPEPPEKLTLPDIDKKSIIPDDDNDNYDEEEDVRPKLISKSQVERISAEEKLKELNRQIKKLREQENEERIQRESVPVKQVITKPIPKKKIEDVQDVPEVPSMEEYMQQQQQQQQPMFIPRAVSVETMMNEIYDRIQGLEQVLMAILGKLNETGK